MREAALDCQFVRKARSHGVNFDSVPDGGIGLVYSVGKAAEAIELNLDQVLEPLRTDPGLRDPILATLMATKGIAMLLLFTTFPDSGVDRGDQETLVISVQQINELRTHLRAIVGRNGFMESIADVPLIATTGDTPPVLLTDVLRGHARPNLVTR